MKLRTMLGICGVAAGLGLCGGSLLAQNDNGGAPGGPGGFGGGGGPGGFGGGGPGGFGAGGNFDPALMQQQRQQQMMAQYKDSLFVTNDDEWAVIQPLIQKVMDAQQAVGSGMGMRMGGRGGRGGRGGAAGFGGAQTSEEELTLQQAIDNNVPAAQIRAALAKYRAARKAKQDNLETAQANLRKVLTARQEAEAVILGLLT